VAVLDLACGANGVSVEGGLQGSFGLSPLNGNGFYWLLLSVAVLCAGVSWFVMTSQTGKVVQAIGRNPSRAAAMGYSVPRFRVALTLHASVIASLGGWLYALQRSYVFVDLLGLNNSINGLVYALI